MAGDQKRSSGPPRSELEEIAYRLRLSRTALDTTPAEICRTTGIAPNTYSQYEGAVSRPEINKAKLLCEFLGYTLDWIYRGEIASLGNALAARIAAVQRDWEKHGEPTNGRRKPSKT